MEKESFSIKKEAFTMVNGKIIICMDLESFIIPTTNQPMRGSGLLTSFMERVKSITISLPPYLDTLIIRILKILIRNGNIMKVTQFATPKKDRVNLFCRMINITKASLEMIKLTAKANLWLKMDKQLKEFGKIRSLL